MKSKTEHMGSTPNKNGKNRENREETRTRSPYTLIDNCEKCTLAIYMDLVCENKVESLIISGKPSADALEAARMAIITEYAELSGSGGLSREMSRYKAYMEYRAQVYFLNLCLMAVQGGEYDVAVENLNKFGFRCKVPVNDAQQEALAKRIEAEIKHKMIRLKNARKDYEKLTAEKETVIITRKMFLDELAVVSKVIGFRISTGVSLAEYASYKTIYTETLKAQK